VNITERSGIFFVALEISESATSLLCIAIEQEVYQERSGRILCSSGNLRVGDIPTLYCHRTGGLCTYKNVRDVFFVALEISGSATSLLYIAIEQEVGEHNKTFRKYSLQLWKFPCRRHPYSVLL